MNHRTHYRIINDLTNLNKCLIWSIQPSSIDGNDATINFIKNHQHFNSYRQIDIVNLVSNVGSKIDSFEMMNADIFSNETRSANRQKIQELLEQNQYDKIFVSVGQHFLSNNILIHRHIYIEEFNAIIQLFEPYQDIIYCFGTTKKKMIGKTYNLPYCICDKNKYLMANQPIPWIFTN